MDLREQGPDGPINGLVQLPGDVPKIAEAVQREHARLAVFDPVVAFIGAEHSAHNEQDVRAALAPLKTVAEEADCAVVLIMHPNKADGSDPLRRIANSGAFTALARSVLLLDPTRRMRTATGGCWRSSRATRLAPAAAADWRCAFAKR